ncbi:DUF4430 domain-containing protein [Novipirellula artificiosorum]|uniref:Transcobalamin-like C-terminal domain-containing protein n=1 Tax=Novipirellula artificiosorum TaxID=2528016 RepID=A0A5C6DD30_9BACT|nr:DUF4430 domain-containing protein [Novipirellula artificiosorum]TWU33784.1 hypothetical protein Poly41_47820 [Novipirellula artificiosorum]
MTHSLLALSVTLSLSGCGRSATERPPLEVTADAAAVTVIIQTPHSSKEIVVQGVLPGSTVESVMQSIDEVPVTVNGSGVTAFVSSMDGVETKASEGWTYKVNGEYADKGIGSVMLVPPATLTWTYGTYDQTMGKEPDSGELNSGELNSGEAESTEDELVGPE